MNHHLFVFLSCQVLILAIFAETFEHFLKIDTFSHPDRIWIPHIYGYQLTVMSNVVQQAIRLRIYIGLDGTLLLTNY